jgi:rod shape determining protein RodA
MSPTPNSLPGRRTGVSEIFPRRFDWLLASAVLVLSLLGVLAIASAAPEPELASRQIAFLAVSAVAMFLVARLDYRTLVESSFWLYLGTVAILAALLFMAPVIAGTKGWLRVGAFRVQPSEFARVVTILLLARFFEDYDLPTLNLGAFLRATTIVAIPMLLVRLENDLGMAATFLSLLGIAWFLGGLRPKVWIGLGLCASLLAGGVLLFGLRDYQKKRIETFLDPGLDRRGAGYQVLQSKIAVGSGGIFGKGYRNGTQSRLGFLPARHTDFILAVVAEESGFVGIVVVLGLEGFVLLRMLAISRRARDRAGAFVAAGVASLLAFHLFVNAGMIIGLVPTTGITMPFLSYGGSSLLSNMIAAGLVLSVEYRRFANA